MADYFPLISRAVQALPEDSTREQRDAIYLRAREALMRQLNSVEPALPSEAIEREKAGLESAVAKLEAELALKLLDQRPVEPIQSDIERWSALETVATSPDATIPDAEAVSTSETSRRPRIEIARPPVEKPKSRNRGVILAAGLPIILGIMGVVGIFAYQNRLKPQDFQKPANTGVSPVSSSGAPNSSITGGTSSDTNSATTILPVAVRASLYEESPTNPQARVELRGAVAWRLEPDTADTGAAPLPRIRGSLEFPDAKLNAEFLIRRNLDASFPASHTLEVRFDSLAGGTRMIKSLALPEFRTEVTEKGPLLQAVKAPDVENTFLLALVNAEPFQSSNITLLKKPGWLYFELRFADGKRGDLVFEKGAAGERVFNEAFAAWGQ